MSTPPLIFLFSLYSHTCAPAHCLPQHANLAPWCTCHPRPRHSHPHQPLPVHLPSSMLPPMPSLPYCSHSRHRQHSHPCFPHNTCQGHRSRWLSASPSHQQWTQGHGHDLFLPPSHNRGQGCGGDWWSCSDCGWDVRVPATEAGRGMAMGRSGIPLASIREWRRYTDSSDSMPMPY